MVEYIVWPVVFWCSLGAQLINPFIIWGLWRLIVRARLERMERKHDAEAKTLRTNYQKCLSRCALRNMLSEIEERKVARREEEKSDSRLWRIFSLYYYFTIWLWVAYLVLSIKTDWLGPGAFGVSIAVIAVCYVLVVWESCFSQEGEYVYNMDMTVTVGEYVESLRSTPPTVGMKAIAWHEETQSYYDWCRRAVQYKTVRVHTGRFTECFQYDNWEDMSKSEVAEINPTGITRIRMTQDVTAGDEETEEAFDDFCDVFEAKYGNKDVHVDFVQLMQVPGFKKRVAAYSDIKYKSWWINKSGFATATLLWLSWPYRWIFNWAVTCRTYYTVRKVFSIRQPTVTGEEEDIEALQDFASPLPASEEQQ